MTNKSKFSFLSYIKNFIFVIPHVFNLLSRMISLSVYEAKLAIRSLMIILMLSFIVGALTTTTWLGLLAMLYIYLTSLQWSPLGAIAIVVLVNVVMLAIVTFIILRVKKNLEFPATRQQLQVIKKTYRE